MHPICKNTSQVQGKATASRAERRLHSLLLLYTVVSILLLLNTVLSILLLLLNTVLSILLLLHLHILGILP